MNKSLLFLACVTLLLRVAETQSPTVICAMILRNEAENLEAHLPGFRPVCDSIVAAIDDRTTDHTAQAIFRGLPGVPHYLFYYRFEGFGAARTLVYKEAYRNFPHMTHILVCDPDWSSRSTFKKSDLDMEHMTFPFTIYDRNGWTTRQSDWLSLHMPGLHFTYRLHELIQMPPDEAMRRNLTIPAGYGMADMKRKPIAWEVDEVEGTKAGRRSWHTDVGHTHTSSLKRLEFDIDLLLQDYQELGDDHHVLYYLGTTHNSKIEAITGVGTHDITPQLLEIMQQGIYFLEKRAQPKFVDDPGSNREQSWASMRWLGYAYSNFVSDKKKVGVSSSASRVPRYSDGRVDFILRVRPRPSTGTKSAPPSTRIAWTAP